jgi:hypothetical protein
VPSSRRTSPLAGLGVEWLAIVMAPFSALREGFPWAFDAEVALIEERGHLAVEVAELTCPPPPDEH